MLQKVTSLFQQNETFAALWFQSLIIALRGYHVYKERAWMYAKVNDKVKTEIEANQISIAIDPYAFAVKAKHKYCDGWTIPLVTFREKFRDIFTSSSKKRERISGNVKSLNFKLLPIPSEGIEVLLLLTFSYPAEWVWNKMKVFINIFYAYVFKGIIHNDNSPDESDVEMDLELTEKEDDKEEVQPSAHVNDDKVA